MPVSQTRLEPVVKGYTKKDFEDGKCTKEGFPLDKKPEPQVLPAAELPVEPETPQEPVGEETPAEGQELPEEPKAEEKKESE